MLLSGSRLALGWLEAGSVGQQLVPDVVRAPLVDCLIDFGRFGKLP